MARALVTVEDVNVVIVDWRGGSLPLYSQAAANTRSVEPQLLESGYWHLHKRLYHLGPFVKWSFKHNSE